MNVRRSTILALVSLGAILGCSGPVEDSHDARVTQPVEVTYLNSGAVLPTDLPFSEAVRVGDTVYLSGQIGIKPGTLELVPGGIEAESRQTMDNIKTTLAAHGYTMDDLVKCTVMLDDIGEWGAFNKIYKTYFSDRFPARSALGADGLALGAKIEVECIAVHSRAENN